VLLYRTATDLLTLAAHKVCNSSFMDSEDYARNILASLGSENSETARILWQSKIDRSIKRNGPLRKHLLSALTPHADKYSAGGVYLGSAPGIRVDTKTVLSGYAEDRAWLT
jgi:hypothetical protein